MSDYEQVSPTHIRSTYDSMEAFANDVDVRASQGPGRYILESESNREWRGGTLTEMLEYGRYGWTGETVSALEAAEDAIRAVGKDNDLTTFRQEWEVAGSEIDIPLFLAGQPECMIEYPVHPQVSRDRVVTLAASCSISGSISADSIRKRGQVVTAFALALSKLGFSLELWLDFTATDFNGNHTVSCRILVKGANDVTDPSRIQFAFAHPGVLRALMFGWEHGLPGKYRKALHVGSRYGTPAPCVQDLPDGTIYLPEVRSSREIPDLDKGLMDLLTKLGVIE